jgi:AAA domain
VSDYSLDDIEAALADAPLPEDPDTPQPGDDSGFQMPDTIKVGERHDSLFRLLRSQKARKISLDAALASCHVENERSPHPINRVELDAYLRRSWTQPDRKVVGAPVERADQFVETERLRRHAKRVVDAEERGEITPPEVLTLRERLARPHPPVRWRIMQLQAVNHRVLLAAQFKAGKTTLAANVVRSLVDGDAFLDTYDVAIIEGTLALLDFEMSASQLDDWYRDQMIENDDRLIVIPMRGAASSFNIIEPEARARWVARLKARGVKYVILDCLRPVLDALGLNEHTEAGLFLTAFDALLREADIPEALVIQHMGHKSERARGDSRLLDWPDVGWTLVRESEDDPASPRFIKAFGRDVDVAETQLAYNPTTRRLAVEGGGSRTDAKVNTVLLDIWNFVAQAQKPPSGRQIEEALRLNDHPQKLIRKAIRDGVARGVLLEADGRNGGKAYQKGEEPPKTTASAATDALEF